MLIHNEESFYIVLPYFKTLSPVSVRGFTLRNSKDLQGRSEEEMKELKSIFSMFYLKDNIKIKEMSYIIIENGPRNSREIFTRLQEFQILLGYLYCQQKEIDMSPYLEFEYLDLYLFKRDRVHLSSIHQDYFDDPKIKNKYPEADEFGRVNGFEVLMNWHIEFFVIKNSRIYPQSRSFYLIRNQDLYMDLERGKQRRRYDYDWALHRLIFDKSVSKTETDKRIILAMQWYNRSVSIMITENISLMYLAIAFETLIGISQGDNLTQRLKESIIVMLGNPPRLDSWIEQFYRARSKIVHEGKTPYLNFHAIDPKQKNKSKDDELVYRSLNSYGRVVFGMCLRSILSGTTLVEDSKLASHLIHNQERLNKICELLSKSHDDIDVFSQISEYVYGLDDHSLHSEYSINIAVMLAAAKLTILRFLDLSIDHPEELNILMQEFISGYPKMNEFYKIERLKSIAEMIESIKGHKYNGSFRRRERHDPINVVWAIVEYAASPGHRLKVWEQRDKSP